MAKKKRPHDRDIQTTKYTELQIQKIQAETWRESGDFHHEVHKVVMLAERTFNDISRHYGNILQRAIVDFTTAYEVCLQSVLFTDSPTYASKLEIFQANLTMLGIA